MKATTDAATETETAELGFDFTSFGDAETWQSICDEFDLVLTELPERKKYAWEGPDLYVVTNANPLTGVLEHGQQKEAGYASYMAAEGEQETVRRFFAIVHERAAHIKGFSLGTQSYIST